MLFKLSQQLEKYFHSQQSKLTIFQNKVLVISNLNNLSSNQTNP